MREVGLEKKALMTLFFSFFEYMQKLSGVKLRCPLCVHIGLYAYVDNGEEKGKKNTLVYR